MKTITQGYVATLGEAITKQTIFALWTNKAKKLMRLTDKSTKSHCVVKNLLEAKNLSEAEINKEYIIDDVIADDKAIINFLFTLGCFKGESVTVISILSENYVITIKDARYSIDADLARAVTLI